MPQFEMRGSPIKAALTWAAVAISLAGFSRRLLALQQRGGQVDNTALQGIKDACILDLKESVPQGLSIQDEADVLREAVVQFEKLLETAVLGPGQSD